MQPVSGRMLKGVIVFSLSRNQSRTIESLLTN